MHNLPCRRLIAVFALTLCPSIANAQDYMKEWRNNSNIFLRWRETEAGTKWQELERPALDACNRHLENTANLLKSEELNIAAMKLALSSATTPEDMIAVAKAFSSTIDRVRQTYHEERNQETDIELIDQMKEKIGLHREERIKLITARELNQVVLLCEKLLQKHKMTGLAERPSWEKYWQAANKAVGNDLERERLDVEALKAAAGSRERDAGSAVTVTLMQLKNLYQDQRFFAEAKEADKQMVESIRLDSSNSHKQESGQFHKQMIALREKHLGQWQQWLTSADGTNWRKFDNKAVLADNVIEKENCYELALRSMRECKHWGSNALLRAFQHTFSGLAQSCATDRYLKREPDVYEKLNKMGTSASDESIDEATLRTILVSLDQQLVAWKACPKCKSAKNVIPIVYGSPRADDFKKQKQGLFVLGGCVVNQDSAHHYCKVCQSRW